MSFCEASEAALFSSRKSKRRFRKTNRAETVSSRQTEMSYCEAFRYEMYGIRLLFQESKLKRRRRVRHALIAIVGCRQTGKRTLATRFNAMNQGRLSQEIPGQYYYTARINLDALPTRGTGELFIKSYVVPPPENLPDLGFHDRERNNFSAIIFLCSVTQRQSFDKMMDTIQHLTDNVYTEGLPHYLVAGNKVDLDRRLFPDYMFQGYGLYAEFQYYPARYHECSALVNTNVDPIFREILEAIIADQP